jgi:hypothetical protein
MHKELEKTMIRKVNGSILAGALLGAAAVSADIVVDDFMLVTGQNSLGGNWLADSDQWAAIGGSSRVLDVTTQADLVQGEGCTSGCYAGHNIFKAYVEEPGTLATIFQADIKVQKDVSTLKKWAYAGWVMNFAPERGKDGKQAWELQPWEKGNEVDISTCDAIEITMQFTLDRQLAEAAFLEGRDRELSAKLQAEQAALAKQLAVQRAAAAAASARSSGPVTISITGSGSIVSVRGIRIHQSIADNLAGLLSAAESDGISLSGYGYRDSQRQVELRRQNCGSSNYAIYQMSPSQCSPPTARPGQSNH